MQNANEEKKDKILHLDDDEELTPTAAQKAALSGSAPPKDVEDHPWGDRPSAESSVRESLRGWIMEIWSSRFMLLLFAILICGILFGVDVAFLRFSQLFIHLSMVLILVRCIQLQVLKRPDRIRDQMTEQRD